MTVETCGTCRWSTPAVMDDGPVMECRRYPPQVIGFDPDGDDVVQSLPRVQESDGCGEWGQRP